MSPFYGDICQYISLGSLEDDQLPSNIVRRKGAEGCHSGVFKADQHNNGAIEAGHIFEAVLKVQCACACRWQLGRIISCDRRLGRLSLSPNEA